MKTKKIAQQPKTSTKKQKFRRPKLRRVLNLDHVQDDDGDDADDEDVDNNDEEDDTSDEDYVESFSIQGHLDFVHKLKFFLFTCLETSLRRKSWGRKKDREILAISFQVASFLAWTNNNKKRFSLDDDLNMEFDSLVLWFSNIVEKPHTILEEFSAHLDDDHKKLPNTTKSYLISLRIFAKWFSIQRDVNVDKFKESISCLIKQYSKEVKRYRSENRLQFSDLVKKKKVPAGGVAEMTEAIREDIASWLSTPTRNLRVTRRVFKSYCTCMFAAFYILTPQGRIGGFEELRFEQLDDLYGEGSICSSTFKTGSKFGFQTFSVSEETEPLVKYYVENFRPIAVRRGKAACTRSFEALWLDYDGNKLAAANIGRWVTNYWQKKTKTSTSTTTCRALVETIAHRAHLDGEITTSQRDAITGVNGHSSQIAQDYYLFHDRQTEASLAIKGFQKIIGTTPKQQDTGRAEDTGKVGEDADDTEGWGEDAEDTTGGGEDAEDTGGCDEDAGWGEDAEDPGGGGEDAEDTTGWSEDAEDTGGGGEDAEDPGGGDEDAEDTGGGVEVGEDTR
jgi:hypothetical protein